MQNSEIVHLTLNCLSLSLFLLLQELPTSPAAADPVPALSEPKRTAADPVPALPEPEPAKRGTILMDEGVSAFNCIINQINEQ